MGIIADVGNSPAVVWAPHAAEPWLRAPLAAPRLISLPTTAPERPVVPVRPVGEPSRMVAMAGVLATWRAAERALASLQAGDPGHTRAEAAIVAARDDYHRLFVEHLAERSGG